MFVGILLGLFVTIRMFPRTPFARLLHEQLVARVASWQRHHLIFAAVVVALCVAGGEVIAIMGSSELASLLAWDFSLYIDAMVTTVALGALARGRSMFQLLRRPTPAPTTPVIARRQRRSRRAKRVRPTKPSTVDDEHAWPWQPALTV